MTRFTRESRRPEARATRRPGPPVGPGPTPQVALTRLTRESHRPEARRLCCRVDWTRTNDRGARAGCCHILASTRRTPAASAAAASMRTRTAPSRIPHTRPSAGGRPARRRCCADTVCDTGTAASQSPRRRRADRPAAADRTRRTDPPPPGGVEPTRRRRITARAQIAAGCGRGDAARRAARRTTAGCARVAAAPDEGSGRRLGGLTRPPIRAMADTLANYRIHPSTCRLDGSTAAWTDSRNRPFTQ
jgi:hypothetical protein